MNVDFSVFLFIRFFEQLRTVTDYSTELEPGAKRTD